MKNFLTTAIVTVLLVGCGGSVDIWTVASEGNIEVVEQHLEKRNLSKLPFPLAQDLQFNLCSHESCLVRWSQYRRAIADRHFDSCIAST